ncbi:Hypothetical predicted protein [Cloeon dipterum]|uniref:Uncharacterized protein n=1 Tax=Cloeon dipterum TaxID=197152 RepID=A0A8S1CI25_9INSE|nr:Hypothetical predicted protein [Cloeon dipterum]
MISKVTIVACVFVVLASMSTTPVMSAFTSGWPWKDMTTGSQNTTPTTTSASSSTSKNIDNNNGGLGQRNPFLTPVLSVSFKFYNNVPIEGPGMPCIGCVYRLTSNGFVMVKP